MNPLLQEIRHNPLLWLLAFVPVVFAAETLRPEASVLLFILSVLAIVPLAALLSHATEAVAAKTGDSVGGLLNATLGNLTELIIALTALRAGEYMLVKASIAGAIVTNVLFLLGMSFFLGGLKHRIQEFNRAGARLQAGLLLLASVALILPSAISKADSSAGATVSQLSVGLSVLLIATYALGMWFSLKTHRDVFASAESGEAGEAPWPLGVALVTLAGVTVLVALVSEVFVESVQKAAVVFGMTPAFVGFIVVAALVGGAAEMASAFAGARKNRLDLSVSIALGSASQIALFVAPVLVLVSYVVGPTPMDLLFWPGAVVMILVATIVAAFLTSSGRSAWLGGAGADGLSDLRHDALPAAAQNAGTGQSRHARNLRRDTPVTPRAARRRLHELTGPGFQRRPWIRGRTSRLRPGARCVPCPRRGRNLQRKHRACDRGQLGGEKDGCQQDELVFSALHPETVQIHMSTSKSFQINGLAGIAVGDPRLALLTH